MGKSFEEYRPDVAHQSILALLDSPLNKAGLLQVYIRTAKNVLIEINPQIRIPRTYKRFAGLMAQCLVKFRIRAEGGAATLMKVVKNPVLDRLPTGIRKIGTSTKGELIRIEDWVMKNVDKDKPCCFVIGAVSKGNPGMENDYVDECVAISSYGLSAAAVCSKVTGAFE